MSIDKKLAERSNGACELCGSENSVSAYIVAPKDEEIVVCATCLEQIEDNSKVDENHWHCLNDSMWNETPAVQVMAYRMLKRTNQQDLLDMLYLEEEVQVWADAGIVEEEEAQAPTRDSNGTILEAGDAVTIIKDLVVKGAGFTAKQGTTVKNISLTNNHEQIEGRVNGTKIVLLSCFLKKL